MSPDGRLAAECGGVPVKFLVILTSRVRIAWK